jgi:ABC-type glycerol-3-phosphate transport system permease component
MHQAKAIQQGRRSVVPRAVSRSALWVFRNWLMALILFLIFMWTFMPILWTLSLSFKGIQELYGMGSMRFIPRVPTLDNYLWLFDFFPDMPLHFRNSIMVSLGTVAVRTFVASLMGYAFARLDFRGRDLIFYSMIIAMFVPRAGGLMARYEMMHTFGLRNSLFGLVLLFASDLSVPLFIMRQNFMSMPHEIEDAARIDGAGRWRLFLEIAVPFAASGMLVVAILTFVSAWGEWLTTITMIDDAKKYTIGISLAMFDTGVGDWLEGEANISQQGIKAAGYLLASIPTMLIYVTMQKYFVKGMTEGALKF